MNTLELPNIFGRMTAAEYIRHSDILQTEDRFFFIFKSLSAILAEKGIVEFPDSSGQLLPCENFFDDWFLYAVPDTSEYCYSLLKLREQEHDAEDDSPADGDTPGVTVSFISFNCEILFKCLEDPSLENRSALNKEINRVVAHRRQRHHKALKEYFIKSTVLSPL